MSHQVTAASTRLKGGDVELLLAAFCSQLDSAWDAGQVPMPQQWLERLPEQIRQAAAVEFIEIELLQRRRRGECLTAEDFLHRYPALKSAISEAFAQRSVATKVEKGIRGETQTITWFASSAEVSPPSDVILFEPPPDTLAPLESLYDDCRLIASGGFGAVYRCRDKRLGHLVAVKVALPADGSSARQPNLQDEARRVCSLRHPWIVQVYALHEMPDGAHAVVMEYLPGGSLRSLAGQGELVTTAIIDIFRKLAEALQYAHQHGVVHRDLKPENILLDEHGQPRIVDFGLAVDAKAEDFAAGARVGTLPYMAPEQMRFEPATPQTEVWALGVMFYELLAGHRPFIGQTFDDVKYEIEFFDPPQIESVPAALNRILQRCLEKDPAKRFQTAAEFATALRMADQSAPKEPTASRSPNWFRILVATVVSAVLGLAVAVWPERGITLAVNVTRLDAAVDETSVSLMDRGKDTVWLDGIRPLRLETPASPGDEFVLQSSVDISVLQIDPAGDMAWLKTEGNNRPERVNDAPLRFAAVNNPPGVHLFLLFVRDKLNPEEAKQVVSVGQSIRASLPSDLPSRWWLGSHGIESRELKMRSGAVDDTPNSTQQAFEALSKNIPTKLRNRTGFVGALMFEFQLPN